MYGQLYVRYSQIISKKRINVFVNDESIMLKELRKNETESLFVENFLSS